jgi:uncharacterized protein involved in exopolysaccharide biosynthesis/MinD-like ATPase involved in chromosome partitioning or flagellar assembly
MSDTSMPEDLSVVDYQGVLRRRWWLIVAAMLIGTLGAVGYYELAHKTYSATASVYVTATAGTANQVSNGRTTGAVDLDTQAQIVESLTIAQRAAKLMSATEAPTQVLSRVSVTVPANSQVLSITCKAGTPRGAALCAQSFAHAYLSYISGRTTSLVKDQILVLQRKISFLQASDAKLTIAIASLPAKSPKRATDNQQRVSDSTQLATLNSQVAQLTEQLANPAGGSIISYAHAPASPSSPQKLLVIPTGLIVGLLVGLILAFIVDRRDRRIRRPQDLTGVGVPVLMSLPLKGPRPELAIATPRSPIGKEFSELAYVLTSTLGAGNHVILISGYPSGAGAGLVAVNLAVALSRIQPDATLICANPEGSVIPGVVGLPPAPGFTDLLATGEASANVGQRLATAPRLRVITPGSATGPEASDLQQDDVDQLLARLGDAVRWVVIEAPPVMSSADVYALAHAADAVVLVAEVPEARSDEVAEAVQHLERTGASVLGAVLLQSPKGTAPGRAPGPAAESNDWLEDPAVTPAAADDDWTASDEASTSIHGS